MPVSTAMNGGISVCGLTSVWNSPSTSPPRTFTAPISVIIEPPCGRAAGGLEVDDAEGDVAQRPAQLVETALRLPAGRSHPGRSRAAHVLDARAGHRQSPARTRGLRLRRRLDPPARSTREHASARPHDGAARLAPHARRAPPVGRRVDSPERRASPRAPSTRPESCAAAPPTRAVPTYPSVAAAPRCGRVSRRSRPPGRRAGSGRPPIAARRWPTTPSSASAARRPRPPGPRVAGRPCAAADAGPPTAADPAEVAALAWLIRPEGWERGSPTPSAGSATAPSRPRTGPTASSSGSRRGWPRPSRRCASARPRTGSSWTSQGRERHAAAQARRDPGRRTERGRGRPTRRRRPPAERGGRRGAAAAQEKEIRRLRGQVDAAGGQVARAAATARDRARRGHAARADAARHGHRRRQRAAPRAGAAAGRAARPATGSRPTLAEAGQRDAGPAPAARARRCWSSTSRCRGPG